MNCCMAFSYSVFSSTLESQRKYSTGNAIAICGEAALCHTDLLRTRGYSLGMPLNRVNWGNYDLVVIDESHNFRNNDAFKDRETRYQRLMNRVIKEGVKTKVLMLSATPVNNRFNDLKNQLALAHEGDPEHLSGQLRTEKNADEIFRRA